MLFEPLDEILGRRSKVRLLRALGPLDRPVSGREAARLAGLSHRAITALDELATLGVVIRREAAGQHLYTFNREHAKAKDSARDAMVLAFEELDEHFGIRLSPVVVALVEARRQAREGSPPDQGVLRDVRRVHGRPLEELLND